MKMDPTSSACNPDTHTKTCAAAQEGGQQQGGATGGAGAEEEAAAPAQPGTTTIAISKDPQFKEVRILTQTRLKSKWAIRPGITKTQYLTATAGTGPQDPNNAKAFDTSIINSGEQSPAVELKGVSQGQSIPYHCMITIHT